MPDREPVVACSLRLPAHPATASAVRHVLRALADHVGEETLFKAELIMSELVTNAVRHGSPNADGSVEVDIEVTPAVLLLRVRDEGVAFSLASPAPTPGDTGGFGLHIVQGLADSLSLRRRWSGNEVRVTLPADPPGLLAV